VLPVPLPNRCSVWCVLNKLALFHSDVQSYSPLADVLSVEPQVDRFLTVRTWRFETR